MRILPDEISYSYFVDDKKILTESFREDQGYLHLRYVFPNVGDEVEFNKKDIGVLIVKKKRICYHGTAVHIKFYCEVLTKE
jgi:hypothetical protein